MAEIIDDTLHRFKIDRKKFVLLQSDAAAYMKAAFFYFDQLDPSLLHISLLWHLMHNVSINISSQSQIAMWYYHVYCGLLRCYCNVVLMHSMPTTLLLCSD